MRKLGYIILLFLLGCGSGTEEPALENTVEDPNHVQLTGEAQGTTYNIIYYDSLQRDFKPEVDSILLVMDSTFSNYLEGSLLSNLNRTDTFTSGAENGHLNAHLLILHGYSHRVYEVTANAFNPCIYPLVKYWGFGPEMKNILLDSAAVDSLVKLVGSQPAIIATGYLRGPIAVRKEQFVQLDYNAIAQGYSVDVIAGFLQEKGVVNYMIELGGEVLTKGSKPNGTPWKLGVDKPVSPDQEREMQVVLEITDKAIATSGSYRKFYEKEGVKYSHTIDPRTGYPVQHSLLSVTVIANECWAADAYATALMVMGLEEGMSFIESNPELGLEAYFISDDGVGGWSVEMTPGFERYIIQ